MFVVIALFAGSAVGMKTLDDEDTGSGQSQVADKAIEAADFPENASESVLVQSRDGKLTVDDPKFQAAVHDLIGRLKTEKEVLELTSPLTEAGAENISKDKRSALVTYELRDTEEHAAEDHVDPVLAQVAASQKANPQMRVESFGDASTDKAISKSFEDDFKKAEFLSLPITLLILVIAFGALFAAGVPLLLALSAVGATIGLLAPVSLLGGMEESISSVVLLVGLAVGIDYSMFYLRREREERARGKSLDASLDAAAATSGHAVLISGLTVMIAMAGMYFAGNPVFTGFATGTIMVVAVAMIGSVTVLPAVLSWMGDRINKGRIPFLGRRSAAAEPRVWGWILDRVLKHPVIAAVAATALLVAMAIPALSLKPVAVGVEGLPKDLAVIQTYDRIQAAFPGNEIPANVVVQAEDVTAPTVRAKIHELEDRALATGKMYGPADVEVSPDKTVAIVDIPLAGKGTDDASQDAVKALRNEVLPATFGHSTSMKATVTGFTAGSMDFASQMKKALPIVFAFVLGFAFVLLLVTFRSVVVPLKAIVLNLLSVGAAYGVLVWIFQEGHLEGFLDFQSIDGITAWLPLFLFVILFGLSMDYHVFILSRIREAVDRGMRTEDAVSHGIKSTAGVVTSAAAVMIAVFAIFATLSSLEFKMMGVGLATAILIDATIIRGVLLPAVMKLLGEHNWYLPRSLRWIPRVNADLRHHAQPEGSRA